MRRLAVTLVALCLLVLAGCQPFNYQKTIELNQVDRVYSVLPDPPSREQKLTITVKSDNPITVHVVLEEKTNKATDDLLNSQIPKDTLLSLEEGTEGKGEVTIPAKTAYAVLLGLGSKSKSAKVDLTLKGR